MIWEPHFLSPKIAFVKKKSHRAYVETFRKVHCFFMQQIILMLAKIPYENPWDFLKKWDS